MCRTSWLMQHEGSPLRTDRPPRPPAASRTGCQAHPPSPCAPCAPLPPQWPLLEEAADLLGCALIPPPPPPTHTQWPLLEEAADLLGCAPDDEVAAEMLLVQSELAQQVGGESWFFPFIFFADPVSRHGLLPTLSLLPPSPPSPFPMVPPSHPSPLTLRAAQSAINRYRGSCFSPWAPPHTLFPPSPPSPWSLPSYPSPPLPHCTDRHQPLPRIRVPSEGTGGCASPAHPGGGEACTGG